MPPRPNITSGPNIGFPNLMGANYHRTKRFKLEITKYLLRDDS